MPIPPLRLLLLCFRSVTDTGIIMEIVIFAWKVLIEEKLRRPLFGLECANARNDID